MLSVIGGYILDQEDRLALGSCTAWHIMHMIHHLTAWHLEERKLLTMMCEQCVHKDDWKIVKVRECHRCQVRCDYWHWPILMRKSYAAYTWHMLSVGIQEPVTASQGSRVIMPFIDVFC